MIPHTEVTQEVMENMDHYDTMTHIHIIEVINGTPLDPLIGSTDTTRETQADTETNRVIIMIAHAHQIVSASEIDAHDGITNIHVLSHPCPTCYL